VIAVADGTGRLVARIGNAEREFYFRSSAKPMQLLPTVEGGAADRFGFGERELAAAASSHSGAPEHVDAAREILARAGYGPEHLGCGYQEPRNRESLRLVMRHDGIPGAVAATPGGAEGGPGGNGAAASPFSPLYNNCSGKHAAMLALSAHLGADPAGYLDPAHPAQALILERTAELAGIRRRDAHFGIDGCSAPTLYAPLAALAAAFGRFARIAREDRQGGAARIHAAMAMRADMLGEPGTFNTVLMSTLGGRLVGKGGAEGLFCVGVPEADLGFAVRIEDGSSRAIGPVVLEVLRQLQVVGEEELGPLGHTHVPQLRNWRGHVVGHIQPVFALERSSSRV
jgi:L-asparaginase II